MPNNVKKLLLAATLLLSVPTMAQNIDVSDGYHLADETWLYSAQRTNNIRIVTANLDIANQLIYWYTPCECISYSSYFKSTRTGKYQEWTIYLPKSKEKEILRAYSEDSNNIPNERK